MRSRTGSGGGRNDTGALPGYSRQQGPNSCAASGDCFQGYHCAACCNKTQPQEHSKRHPSVCPGFGSQVKIKLQSVELKIKDRSWESQRCPSQWHSLRSRWPLLGLPHGAKCTDFEGHGNGTRGCFSSGNIKVISKQIPLWSILCPSQSLPLQAAEPATQPPLEMGELHILSLLLLF